MPSVIDMIATAEAEAQQIRDAGQAKSREIVANANTQLRAKLASAKETAAQKLVARRKSAQEAALRLTSEILSSRAKDSEKLCRDAESNLDHAVTYILGKAGLQ